MFVDDAAFEPRTSLVLAIAALVLAGSLTGCVSGDSDEVSLKQTGSSTVLPLAQVWAEEFPFAAVSVSGGGSSHGLNALLTHEADLGDASRKIGPGDYDKVGCSVSESQIQQAQSGPHPWVYPACNGVEPTEWVVAYDILSVVVHPSNDWVGDGLTYEQLRSIFTTENTAETWDEVPGLEDAPNEEIQIYAPDEASGTYEFFFEEIAGGTDTSLLAAGNDRYSPSADDNVILNAVAHDELSVGFFGLAYYLENEDAVQAVPVADGQMDGPVEPSFETAADYPITRPVHIYTDGIPDGSSATSEAIRAYLAFALSDAGQAFVPDVGYVKVSDFAPEIHQSQAEALAS